MVLVLWIWHLNSQLFVQQVMRGLGKRKIDVLIWDEASMSSARMLELVNALHHKKSEEGSCEESLPFAAKQVIIVDEFLQLRHAPSSFNSGAFMLLSRVFEYAIRHRFQLMNVLSRSASNTMFLAALSDIRLGICSEKNACIY